MASFARAVGLAKGALDYLLGGPAVGGVDEERLRRWSSLPGPDMSVPHARGRYVVVSTGAKPADRRHRAVVLAAVAVERMQLDYAGCFTAAVRAHSASEPKAAMLGFLEFLQKAPLVAYDASLERARVERTMKGLLGVPLRHPWIELGALLRALFRDARCTSLEQWRAHFGIGPEMPEPALGEALVCAQLLLIALDAAARAGATNAGALNDLAQATAPAREA